MASSSDNASAFGCGSNEDRRCLKGLSRCRAVLVAMPVREPNTPPRCGDCL